MTLKCTYYLPEFKLFASVIKVLEELNKGSADKQELGIVFTILKILDYYQLISYPFRCKLCNQKLFSGYFYKESYYCLEHGERLSEEYRTLFALTTETGRVNTISFLLKELLNIDFNYPAPMKGEWQG